MMTGCATRSVSTAELLQADLVVVVASSNASDDPRTSMTVVSLLGGRIPEAVPRRRFALVSVTRRSRDRQRGGRPVGRPYGRLLVSCRLATPVAVRQWGTTAMSGSPKAGAARRPSRGSAPTAGPDCRSTAMQPKPAALLASLPTASCREPSSRITPRRTDPVSAWTALPRRTDR
jgi:hypothetical protein